MDTHKKPVVHERQVKIFKDGEEVVKLSTVVYGILILIVAIMSLMIVLAYGINTKFTNNLAASMSKFIPVPAAVIGWNNVITLGQIDGDLSSIERFYKANDFTDESLKIDFATDEGQKKLKVKEREVLDKMIQDRVVEILAKKRGLSLNSGDIDQAVAEKLNEFGTAQDVKTQLSNLYGWTLDDFKQKVIIPGLYQTALAASVASEDKSIEQLKAKMEEARKELVSGKDFAEVARNYSQGASKDNGGELGWVKKNQVIAELQGPLFGKNPFEKNTIIESSIGFHIVEIENRKTENGEDVLQIRQIFIAKKTFADWLAVEMKQMRIFIPLSDFVWNKENSVVEFSSKEMNQFEREQRDKLKGDASILF